jgi:hypothetical protein
MAKIPTLARLKAEYDGLPPEAKKDVPTFENWLALNQFTKELQQYLESAEYANHLKKLGNVDV